LRANKNKNNELIKKFRDEKDGTYRRLQSAADDKEVTFYKFLYLRHSHTFNFRSHV